MKIVLILALALIAPRLAAETDGLDAVKNEAQQRVLRDKGLVQPPNLRAWGLAFDADGVYRAAALPPGAPAGTPRRTASAEQVAAALARWQASNSTAVLTPSANAPRPRDAAAVIEHGERRRVVDATLHAAAENLTVAQRFDAAFGAAPARTPPPAQNEAVRRSLVRLGYERLADGSVSLPAGNDAPSAWAGLTSAQIDGQLITLRRAGDEQIRAHRDELIRLVSGGSGDQRGYAIQLLGRLHDDSLLPVLLPAIMRERDHHNKKMAADALAALAVSYKAKDGSWGAFLDKAPPILNVMFKSSPNWDYGAATITSLYTVTDLLNLMQPADKKRFLGGFDDPRVMLMILSLGNADRVEREAGVHSDTAALVYARFKELSARGGPGVGAFLNDPSVSAETRANLLGRLNRYKLVGPELARDEAFRRGLPALLFGPGSKVASNTVFSVAVLASRTKEADFARHAMAFIRSAPAKDARPALVFFLLHPQMLDAEQRSELNARVDGLDAGMRRAMDEFRRTPSVYSYWPKTGPVDAALLMTQEGHAQAFMKTLAGLGYTAQSRPGGEVVFTRGLVRLSVTRFASDQEGWAIDRDAVARAVAARLRDPKYQIVAYRGHMGDYGKSPLSGGEDARGKVFIDLSCDSDSLSDEVMHQCVDCAFFGTNQTGEGAVNNAFLPEALAGLAARESFADMNKRFQAHLPKLFHRFTGSWSPARLWEEASGR